jgi:hypothetical protein
VELAFLQNLCLTCLFFLVNLFTRIVASAVGRGCREVRVRKSFACCTYLSREKSTGWLVTSAVGRGCREVRVRKSRMTARSLVGTDLLQEKSTGWLMGGLL